MSRATALGALKKNDNRKKAPLAHLDGTSETDLKQCADKNLGPKVRQRGTRFILPSVARLGNRPSPAHLSDILFSFHFSFSAAVENLRWRLVAPG
jgi:hypothetical protein